MRLLACERRPTLSSGTLRSASGLKRHVLKPLIGHDPGSVLRLDQTDCGTPAKGVVSGFSRWAVAGFGRKIPSDKCPFRTENRCSRLTSMAESVCGSAWWGQVGSFPTAASDGRSELVHGPQWRLMTRLLRAGRTTTWQEPAIGA